MKIRRVPWLRDASRVTAAVMTMWAAAMVVHEQVFPYAGGAFHAMFAYSDGRLTVAYLYYGVLVGTVCAVAALLVACGYRLPWVELGIAATVTAGSDWWSVFAWPLGQSAEFHRVAGLLLLAIPLIAFAACGAAHALRRRLLAGRATRTRIAGEPAE